MNVFSYKMIFIANMIIVIHILFLQCLFSQQINKGFKFEKITSNIDSITNQECVPIHDNNLPFTFYVCNLEIIHPVSFVQDTVRTVFEYKMQLHFTDSLDFFTIENVSRLSSKECDIKILMNISDKEYEKIVFHIMENAFFYYKDNGQRYFINGKCLYIIFPLIFIPDKKK